MCSRSYRRLSPCHHQTEWFIVPSARVGGDAFGYGELDDDKFVSFLFDVSGHGIGAAMLSVSILNVLRQRALPGCDFKSRHKCSAG